MTEVLRVTWAHNPSILRSSLEAWWSSAVPRPSISWRLFFWAVVWVGVLASAIVVGALGLDPAFVLAGLVGIGVFIIGFFTLQRVRMRAFYRALDQHWEAAGDTTVEFTVSGVRVFDHVSTSQHEWAAIDAIGAGRASTVLRIGISMIAIPNAAVPDGLTPRAFRDQIGTLRQMAKAS